MTQQKPHEMSFDLEQQFILRMPEEAARYLSEDIDASVNFKDSLSIEMKQDMRNGLVRYNGQVYRGRLMDLPCIVESHKTTDRKNFYKTADISQMMICTQDENDDGDAPIRGSAAFLAAKSTHNRATQQRTSLFGRDNRDFQYLHGITPPLKNVLRRRFRKTRKKRSVDMPQIEKEVKNLLRADLQADSVVWEVVWSDPPKPADATASQTAAHSSSGQPSAGTRKTSPTSSKLGAPPSNADLSDEDHESLIDHRVSEIDHLFGVVSSSDDDSDQTDSDDDDDDDDEEVERNQEQEEPTPAKSGPIPAALVSPSSSASSSSPARGNIGRLSPPENSQQSENAKIRAKYDMVAAQLHLSDDDDDSGDNGSVEENYDYYEDPVDELQRFEAAARIREDTEARALVHLEDDVADEEDDDEFIPAGGELLDDVDHVSYHQHPPSSPVDDVDDDDEQF